MKEFDKQVHGTDKDATNGVTAADKQMAASQPAFAEAADLEHTTLQNMMKDIGDNAQLSEQSRDFVLNQVKESIPETAINQQWVKEQTRQLSQPCQEKCLAGPTLEDYTKNYLSVFKPGETIENNTRAGYEGYLNNYVYPKMGKLPVGDITSWKIQDYINDLSEKLCKETIQKHVELLRQVFDGAVEDGYLKINPARSSRLRIHGRKSQLVVAYTESEYNALRQLLLQLQGSDQLYVAISCYTGMRQGEICALEWTDIDLENNMITVNKSVEWAKKNQGRLKEPKSKNGIRTVVILPQLKEILLQHRQESGYLIKGKRGKEDGPVSHTAMVRLNQRVNRIAEEQHAGVRFSNRKDRHTVATFMNNAKVDDITITSQIGHHDADFTRRRYMNDQETQVQRGMKQFGDFLEHIAEQP